MSKLDSRFPLYAKLLYLYPQSYRQKYGHEMLQTLADMLDDTNRSKTGVWFRTSLDLPCSLTKENLLYVTNILSHETPDYVKRVSLFSGLLLLPFFVFISLNALTAHNLYNSWFWIPKVIAIWLIFMPTTAFLIATATFIYWASHRRANKSFWSNLFDFRRNWPLSIVVFISVGIITLAFGHDSVHCIVNNPINEIHYWRSTLNCIKHG
jgi:hypothetical protein